MVIYHHLGEFLDLFVLAFLQRQLVRLNFKQVGDGRFLHKISADGAAWTEPETRRAVAKNAAAYRKEEVFISSP
jgi:hypothetical protein